jgi:hypothetical protein
MPQCVTALDVIDALTVQVSLTHNGFMMSVILELLFSYIGTLDVHIKLM